MKLPTTATPATPGHKLALIKVTTRESGSAKAMLNVRLSLPEAVAVEGQVLSPDGKRIPISQFQIGLN